MDFGTALAYREASLSLPPANRPPSNPTTYLLYPTTMGEQKLPGRGMAIHEEGRNITQSRVGCGGIEVSASVKKEQEICCSKSHPRPPTVQHKSKKKDDGHLVQVYVWIVEHQIGKVLVFGLFSGRQGLIRIQGSRSMY